MITHVHITNFKSLADTATNLGMFNVLIGNNGAGKSSFFRALGLLRDLVANDSVNAALDSQRTDFNDLVSLRSTHKAIGFRTRIQLSPQPDLPELDALFGIEIRKRRFCYVSHEQVVPWQFRERLPTESELASMPFALLRLGRQRMIASEGTRQIKLENQVLSHSFLRDVLRQHEFNPESRAINRRFPLLGAIASSLIRYAHFEIWGPEKLRQPSRRIFGARIHNNGANLASAIQFMRRNRPRDFESLRKDMCEAYPWLEDIEVREYSEKEVGLAFVEKTTLLRGRTKKRYSPSQVSDGLLRMLALCTIRHTPHLFSTVAYEEPENGLHPSMISKSAKLLREIHASGTQVLVSTHSPLFLNEVFSECPPSQIASELKLVRRDTRGFTTIDPPETSIVESAQQQGFSIGDLWSMLLGENELYGG